MDSQFTTPLLSSQPQCLSFTPAISNTAHHFSTPKGRNSWPLGTKGDVGGMLARSKSISVCTICIYRAWPVYISDSFFAIKCQLIQFTIIACTRHRSVRFSRCPRVRSSYSINPNLFFFFFPLFESCMYPTGHNKNSQLFMCTHTFFSSIFSLLRSIIRFLCLYSSM